MDSDEVWIWRLTEEGKVRDWQAYARAHSAAQNARGRAHYLCGDYEGALIYLRWAVDIHAPEAFAKPFVNIASTILQLKSKYAVDWTRQAEEYLNKALEINPNYSKAHHLLGLVFADPSEGQYEKAKQEFKAAGDHWASHAEHARILCEQDEDYEGALQLLRKSLTFERRADERASLFSEAVSKLAETEAASEQLVLEGIKWAEALKTQGLTETLKKHGHSLHGILKGQLDKLRQGSGTQPSALPSASQ